MRLWVWHSTIGSVSYVLGFHIRHWTVTECNLRKWRTGKPDPQILQTWHVALGYTIHSMGHLSLAILTFLPMLALVWQCTRQFMIVQYSAFKKATGPCDNLDSSGTEFKEYVR